MQVRYLKTEIKTEGENFCHRDCPRREGAWCYQFDEALPEREGAYHPRLPKCREQQIGYCNPKEVP